MNTEGNKPETITVNLFCSKRRYRCIYFSFLINLLQTFYTHKQLNILEYIKKTIVTDVNYEHGFLKPVFYNIHDKNRYGNETFFTHDKKDKDNFNKLIMRVYWYKIRSAITPNIDNQYTKIIEYIPNMSLKSTKSGTEYKAKPPVKSNESNKKIYNIVFFFVNELIFTGRLSKKHMYQLIHDDLKEGSVCCAFDAATINYMAIHKFPAYLIPCTRGTSLKIIRGKVVDNNKTKELIAICDKPLNTEIKDMELERKYNEKPKFLFANLHLNRKFKESIKLDFVSFFYRSDNYCNMPFTDVIDKFINFYKEKPEFTDYNTIKEKPEFTDYNTIYNKTNSPIKLSNYDNKKHKKLNKLKLVS